MSINSRIAVKFLWIYLWYTKLSFVQQRPIRIVIGIGFLDTRSTGPQPSHLFLICHPRIIDELEVILRIASE